MGVLVPAPDARSAKRSLAPRHDPIDGAILMAGGVIATQEEAAL